MKKKTIKYDLVELTRIYKIERRVKYPKDSALDEVTYKLINFDRAYGQWVIRGMDEGSIYDKEEIECFAKVIRHMDKEMQIIENYNNGLLIKNKKRGKKDGRQKTKND